MIERYFYRGSVVVTTLQPSYITTSLAYGRQTMAFLTGTIDHACPTLVAIDAQKSAARYSAAFGQQTISFSVYGQMLKRGSLPVAFKGERRDPFIQHYLLGMGYRSYSPNLMRFISPDRDSPFDRGGLNAYAFVLGDPINHSDPSGHGIGEFIQPKWRTVRPYITFGKTRHDNKHLKDIVVTSGMKFDSNEYTMDVIFGHGDGWTVGGLAPGALKEQLKHNNAPLTGGPIHLISCRAGASAATHGSGFPMVAYGQEFSNIMDSPVTTYTEPVMFNLGLTPKGTLIDLELIEASYLDSGPVTFYPEKQPNKKGVGLLRRVLSKIRT